MNCLESTVAESLQKIERNYQYGRDAELENYQTSYDFYGIALNHVVEALYLIDDENIAETLIGKLQELHTKIFVAEKRPLLMFCAFQSAKKDLKEKTRNAEVLFDLALEEAADYDETACVAFGYEMKGHYLANFDQKVAIDNYSKAIAFFEQASKEREKYGNDGCGYFERKVVKCKREMAKISVVRKIYPKRKKN